MMLTNLKQFMFSLKMKRKKRERNNTLLHGSNDICVELNRILWRKRHRIFSLVSFVSGCLILLFFAVSVFSPPPAANLLFLPPHSLVRTTSHFSPFMRFSFLTLRNKIILFFMCFFIYVFVLCFSSLFFLV